MKVAAGFLIFKKLQNNLIEYLLLQTSYGIHHWTPPKGHVDRGETELETAYRETEEESGLIRCDLKVHENLKKVLEYPVNGKPKKVVYWLAELINENAKVRLSDEHQDYKWSNLEEAVELVQFPDLQLTLKEFDKYIKSNLL